MSGPVVADQTGPIQAHHNRQVLKRDIVNDLIVGSLQEGRIDRQNTVDALGGQSRRKRPGMSFGDADIKKPIGILLREFTRPVPGTWPR